MGDDDTSSSTTDSDGSSNNLSTANDYLTHHIDGLLTMMDEEVVHYVDRLIERLDGGADTEEIFRDLESTFGRFWENEVTFIDTYIWVTLIIRKYLLLIVAHSGKTKSGQSPESHAEVVQSPATKDDQRLHQVRQSRGRRNFRCSKIRTRKTDYTRKNGGCQSGTDGSSSRRVCRSHSRN